MSFSLLHDLIKALRTSRDVEKRATARLAAIRITKAHDALQEASEALARSRELAATDPEAAAESLVDTRAAVARATAEVDDIAR